MSAKFRIPELWRSVVLRPRLLNQLTAGVRGPLTLVSAPAGWGKTVLVSSWIAARCWPGPVTWITLDADDDQPAGFWSYVMEGLVRSGVAVPDAGISTSAGVVDRSLLIRLSACLSERSEPCVLVLDHVERLTNPAVLDEIDFVLGHAAPQLRMVLVTRVNPRVPLHRYRLAGSVTEIRIDDLAFSVEEVRQLLTESRVTLSEGAILDLSERTKGWPAGLRMAAMSIEDGSDGDDIAKRFDGERVDVAGYFLAEVLDGTDARMRDFLLRTSVVDPIYPELAEELSERGDAARILASMACSGNFIEAIDDGRSYRYHPLFRDLLTTQVSHELRSEVASLHERAATWLAGSGRVDDAVRHAAGEAGNWTLAAALIVRYLSIGRLLAGAQAGGVARSLANMPDDVPGAEPAVVLAAMALVRHDHDACSKHLARAGEIVDERPERWANALALAIAVVQVLHSCGRADLDGATAAATAADSLITELEKDGVVAPAQLRALLLCGLGGTQLGAGQISAAETSFTIGARVSNVAGCERLRLDCLGQLALIQALHGRLRRAADLARAATALANGCGADTPPPVELALAWIATEECDFPAARAHAERAAAIDTLRDDPVLPAILALVRARLLRMRGELAAAGNELRAAGAGTSPTPVPDWLRQRLAGAETSLAIMAGRRNGPAREPGDTASPDLPADANLLAWAMLERHDSARVIEHAMADLHNESLPLDRRIDAWLLTAAGQLAQDRSQLARAAIDQALRLAEPEQLRRPILEAPPSVRRFLRRHTQLVDGHQWLTAGSSATTRAHRLHTPKASVMLQPLTERERDVLRLLAALLSTEEIAEKMFISVNTVKTHIRGILRKLSAVRRNDAVRRAREYGLI